MSDFPSHPYPWQLQEWHQLNQQIAAGKLPHALMFAGAKGIGKRHLAEALAQLLLCLSPIEGTPCGKCRGCMLNRVHNHPDFIVIEPEEGAKGIKVDQVRSLIDDLGKTAQQGGFKVVVLEPAEAMNANAANALLKSLEEPAANTLLVLVCHAPSSVLPTIRSRCQMRLLATPNSEQVIHWLKPLMVGSNIPVEKLMEAAGGAPLTALSYLESDALERRDAWLLNLVRLSTGQISAIEVAAQWQKDDVIALVEWFLVWLHSVIRWQVGAEQLLINQLPQDLRERLMKIPGALLHRYVEKMLVSKRQLLGNSNPNKQLLLEEMLMDWGALLRTAK
ncbi:DNA polymerase III subunit delta' [Cellvibrio zantedeschiae]|uniref:DNA polymerase III subunit delta' n=1 Tax=Cellvibrio zantedeschiae TaxID=1237077 RepID=A0ABQ3AZZ0_9GAMM|nr:DNA polymerase III subunit delta' [Cellvibrio zantedeschiae]GGY69499.1 DNA polymerase III subunit delta' [Cellvibrio zantedeschiae]